METNPLMSRIKMKFLSILCAAGNVSSCQEYSYYIWADNHAVSQDWPWYNTIMKLEWIERN